MISLNWVKDYVDIENRDLKKLATEITQAGINVEKVVTKHIDNLVIGEVLTCENHPDSDHLHICLVDIGNETLQIVCGAKNVRQGIKVIVAKDGCVLPGNNVIKKGKIRGVESNGMICALFELGIDEKTEENYNKGICELNSDAVVGEDPLKYLGLDDTLYELDVHKHRNNDCYYHIGFAYEIGTILNKKVTLPDTSYKILDKSCNNLINLTVNTSKCPYFLTKLVKDVEIKESPDFIKKRLESVGMRSINNVVDISNYVMLEFGQPLHFYDYDSIGKFIEVRNAKENEKIITLDNKERTLTSNDIVITDGVKPVSIAGVMGGMATEVENTTKNILIESAIFDNVSIRNTANRLNLRSEASVRFGKGLNYEYTLLALNRACHLLEKYANAKIYDGIVMYDNIDKTPKVVTFKKDDINKMLGIDISTSDMEKELDRLDFKYTLEDGIFTCTIPNRRLDIDPFVNDLAEEIGRLYGYHNLKSTLPKLEIKQGDYEKDVKFRKDISKRCRTLGLNEVKTYTLTSIEMADSFKYKDIKNIYLPNPMSIDKSVVRTSLIPSLLNIYDYNKARKQDNICIYEISKVYDENYNEDTLLTILMKGNLVTTSWNSNSLKVDFYLIKGIIENILDYVGLKNRYSFEKDSINDIHPKIGARIFVDKKEVGIIGKVHPSIKKDDIYVCEISLKDIMMNVKPIKFKEASIYPEIVKDVAFIIKKDVEQKALYDVIKHAGSRLLTNIEVFDVYTGTNVKEDEKSIAYKLTFSDNTRTLEEDEVMEVFKRIIDEVTTKCNAVLRDK